VWTDEPSHIEVASQANLSNLPIGESVFDVVRGGVDEHPRLLPSSRLDPDVLVDGGQRLELTVADDDIVLGQQGHVGHVAGPYHVFDLGLLD